MDFYYSMGVLKNVYGIWITSEISEHQLPLIKPCGPNVDGLLNLKTEEEFKAPKVDNEHLKQMISNMGDFSKAVKLLFRTLYTPGETMGRSLTGLPANKYTTARPALEDKSKLEIIYAALSDYYLREVLTQITTKNAQLTELNIESTGLPMANPTSGLPLATPATDKPYRCHLCGRGFTQRGNLEVHMWTQHGNK